MNLLQELKDVDGVFGSILLDEQGGVCERDFPAMFSDDTLQEAAARVMRWVALSESTGPSADTLLMTFPDYKMVVRRHPGRLLVAIAETRTNVPALRMAMNLILRRASGPHELPPRISRPLPRPPTPQPPSVQAANSAPPAVELLPVARMSTLPEPPRAPIGPSAAPQVPGASSSVAASNKQRTYRGRPIDD